MANKMLIDATHPEETRVVVVRGSRVEEFDFESASRKPLRGNIYLAKVTRVEPSLQAAFVEYGGNRHGFLAFSEIHPDYYQIPVADRQALLEDEARAERDEERDEERREKRGRRDRGRRGDRDNRAKKAAADETVSAEVEATSEDVQVETDGKEAAMVNEGAPAFGEYFAPDVAESTTEDAAANAAPLTFETVSVDAVEVSVEAPEGSDTEARKPSEDDGDDENGNEETEEAPEQLGGGDALDDMPERRQRSHRRQYKIQEVIKRRQIILVQVVKEERGNKGAALTTYLSLAGRYSVLMPNTGKGGGISRKITNAEDRKRLKEIATELEVPEGMGLILRTAGASRTKVEIRRDYEYLMRMWENVRTLTLQSTAPALVYEEGSLIKRSVRDLYNKDIEEILVAGDDGYREAKDFMRMLMPSHAKVVQPYRDLIPIFARNGIEAQLDRMLQPQVTLKSGGYIIINQTEALVSIDVNSGRSTKEHSIEETALHTNLEAAEEVARQLRLRDLAGLIVIDFIDMEENRNNRAVEKRLKDHLKNDRARIQVGRISHFGLLEMSRQRIRASVLESTMKPCPHCGGTGHIRSDSSVALHVVRAIEEFLIKDARNHITVRTPAATALYVLNHKRRNLTELEERFGLTISIEADETLGNQLYAITRGAPVERPVVTTITEQPLTGPVEEEDVDVEEIEDEEVAVEATEERRPQQAHGERHDGDGEDGGRRKRRRRRRRRGGRDRDGAEQGSHPAEQSASDDAVSDDAAVDEAEDEGGEETEAPESEAVAADDSARKRRRGKRGGRRNRRDESDTAGEDDATETTTEFAEEEGFVAAPPVEEVQPEAAAPTAEIEPEAVEAVEAPVKKPRRAPRKTKAALAEEAAAAAEAEVAAAAPTVTEPEAIVVSEPTAAPAAEEQPTRPSRRRAGATDIDAPVVPKVSSNVTEAATEEKPKRAGWWQRNSFF